MSITILETNTDVINTAMHTAFKEACKVIRDELLGEIINLPSLNEPVPTTLNGLRGYVFFYNVFKDINGTFTEDHAKQACQLIKYDRSTLLGLIQDEATSIKAPSAKDVHPQSQINMGFKLITMSLMRQRILRGKWTIKEVCPYSGLKAVIYGKHILPKAVKIALSIETSFDDINSKWTERSYLKADPHHRQLAFLAATQVSWQKPEDISLDDIVRILQEDIDSTNKKRTIKTGLRRLITGFHLLSDNLNSKLPLFELIDSEACKGITIATEEYQAFATASKNERNHKRRIQNKKIKIKNLSSEEARELSLEKQTRLIKETLSELVAAWQQANEYDDEFLCLEITNLKLGPLWPRQFAKTSILPDEVNFEWSKDTMTWVQASLMYLDLNNRINTEKAPSGQFALLFSYLFLYLPIWRHFHDNEYEIPCHPDQFSGGKFISRPLEADGNTPLPVTFSQYLRLRYDKGLIGVDSFNNCLGRIEQFYQMALSRPEHFQIKTLSANPVGTWDKLKTSKRGTTNKPRIDENVYWLMFLYCYTLYDAIKAINSATISGKLLPEHFRRLISQNSNGEYTFSPEFMKKILGSLPEATYQGNTVKFRHYPKTLFSFKWIEINGEQVKVIHPGPITHIITVMETGIRNQHIQWLFDEFDTHIKQSEIDITDIYPMIVNTDKAKRHRWVPEVSGRVIKILREMKDFKNSITDPTFQDQVLYETDNAKWGLMRPLFSFTSSYPFTDTVYERVWRGILFGTQKLIDQLGIDFILHEPVTKNMNIRNLKTDFTPHSIRVTVVSEAMQFLPKEVIGQKITGQTPALVGYYAKHSQSELKQLRQQQKAFHNKLNTMQQEPVEANLAVTSAHRKDSAFAQAVAQNPSQAMSDFGCISTNFFDDDNNGINLVSKPDAEFIAGYERGHMCPYNFVCPERIVKRGLAKRCTLCPHAIRNVDHLPYISALRRQLTDELKMVEKELSERLDFTEQEKIDRQQKRRIITEDLAALAYAEKVLNINLKRLKEGKARSKYVMAEPEAVKQDIMAASYPAETSGAAYLLRRLEECESYPSLHTPHIQARAKQLQQKLLINRGRIREAMLSATELSPITENAYSLIKTIMDNEGLTRQQLISIADADVNDLYKPSIELDKLLGAAYEPETTDA